MRILTSNPNSAQLKETCTLNELKYDIYLFFEMKKDNTIVQSIPWGIVEELFYQDDIFSIGITGHLTISNIAGVFDTILNNTDQFYIGYRIVDNQTKYEDNIYFNIISSTPIIGTASSSSRFYNLKIMEAFLAESTQKYISILSSITPNGGEKNAQNSISQNILNKPEYGNLISHFYTPSVLASYTYQMMIAEPLTSDTTDKNITSIDIALGKYDNKIISLDFKSLEQISKEYTSETLSTSFINNISNEESIYDFLSFLNSNLFFTSESNQLIGIPGTFRSENVSAMTLEGYDYSKETGERKLVMRTLKDTFKNTFNNNIVYELFVGQDELSTFNVGYGATFVSALSPFNMVVLPINFSQVQDEWCDFILMSLNNIDAFEGITIKFDDIIKEFENQYLYKKSSCNIYNNNLVSRGLNIKYPTFNDVNLNFCAGGKVLRSIVTLNTALSISIAGGIHRKANEIIYIDNSLLHPSITNISQTSFINNINSNCFYVTSVIHKFNKNNYTNQLNLAVFSENK